MTECVGMWQVVGACGRELWKGLGACGRVGSMLYGVRPMPWMGTCCRDGGMLQGVGHVVGCGGKWQEVVTGCGRHVVGVGYCDRVHGWGHVAGVMHVV